MPANVRQLSTFPTAPDAPAPHGHAVQFFEDQAFLARVVAEFVLEGLNDGASALVVAKKNHREIFARELEGRGFDAQAQERGGRLTWVDAHELLSGFMGPEGPRKVDFERLVVPLLQSARRAAPGGRVRVFGEMVSALCEEGRVPDAVRLEDLWNELGSREPFELLCAYGLHGGLAESGEAFDRICAQHHHVTPTERFAAAGSSPEQLREISRLQHRAARLELELAQRRALERSLRDSLAERERVEADLLRRERELADFFDNAAEGLHWVAADGTILKANRAELELLGYTAEEYVGHNIAEFHADPEVLRDILTRLSRRETLHDQPARLRCKDGSLRHVLIHSNALFHGDLFIHTRCFTRDVTDRVRREENESILSRATALLASSLDAEDTLRRLASLLVSERLAAWCFIHVEQEDAPLRIAVHRASEERRRSEEQLRAVEGRRDAARGTHAVLRTGEPELHPDVTEELLRDLGLSPAQAAELRAEAVSSHLCVPMHGKDGALGALTLMSATGGRRYDASDLALAQQLADRMAMALENARLYREARASERERAELLASERAANRAKDEFLAMLGHELRNPLSPILTSLQLMKLRLGDTAAKERAIIERQVRHLSRLVDDLLDIARITRGRVSLRRQPLDLKTVIARAIEMTSPLLEARRHELSTSLPEGDLPVQGDDGRLAQVLTNLLTNAAHYTPPGGRVEVTASREGGQVVVRVKDSGIGIAPSLLTRIFEPFVQGERTIDRAQGGLGLGLAIARSLATAHGGALSATSEGEGRGSTFELRLPLGAASEQAPAPVSGTHPAPTTPARRILVVDDNRDAAEVLADALSASGHDVRFVNSGPEALELAVDFRPELALLDVGLPVMDGFELARRLRSMPSAAGLKVVALTGYGQPADRERSLAAGMDLHLVKPVELNELERVVEALFLRD